MVEQLGPVVGVGGGAEDVHHHEVLDVVLFPPRLLQLVDIISAITCIEYDHLEEPDTLADLQILSIFLIMGMFTSSSCSLLGLTVEVERALSPDEVTSLGGGDIFCTYRLQYTLYLLVNDTTEFFIMQDILIFCKIVF